MTIPLEYNLSVIGQRDVDRAFLALEQRVAQHVKRVEQITGLHGRGGGVANDRTSATGIRSAARLEAEATRASAREARARAKNEEQWENYTRTIKDRRLREDEKRERQQTKTHEQEAKKRARTEDQLRKSSERAALRSAHDAGAARMGFARSVGGTLGAIGRSGLALTGLGGGAIAANAVHDQMRVESLAAGLAGKVAGRGASEAQIRTARDTLMVQSASVRGMKQDQVLGMAEGFGALTGDYAAGTRMAPDLGKLSLATGADPAELARVAGNVQMKLKSTLSGKNLEAAVMESTRLFAGQGEMGAVDIKDFATYAGRITATASMFSGNRERNMGSLGAIAQAAIGSGSASSAEEATSAVARLGSDLMTKKEDIRKLGINIFDGDKLKAPEELLTELITKTGGNMSKLDPLLGQMSMRPVLGLSAVYGDAEAQKKGSGKQALTDYFEGMRKGGFTKDDIDKRANVIMESPEIVLMENMKKLNMAIGKELIPVVTKFVGQIGEAAPAIGKFASAVGGTASWFLDNPFKGLGAVVSGVIAKELLSAGIGKIISGALSGGAGGPAGAISGIGGWAGAVAGGAVVGFSAYSATYAALEAADDSDKLGRSLSGLSIETTNAYNRLGAAPDKELAAKAQLALLDKSEQGINKAMGNAGLVTSLMSGGAGESIGAKQVIAEQREAAKAMLDAAQALKMSALPGGGGVGGKPNQGGHPTWYGPQMSGEY
jgi:hypothetical protein